MVMRREVGDNLKNEVLNEPKMSRKFNKFVYTGIVQRRRLELRLKDSRLHPHSVWLSRGQRKGKPEGGP